jgi:hypothetical protein
MNKLLTALILVATAATAQANDKWIYSVAKDIHPEVKVQKIDTEVECREISRNLKGATVYYTGEPDGYGGRRTFNGVLNSKGQYIQMMCSSKSGNWALIAPKAVIDGLIAEQQQKQAQRSNNLNNKVKGSGLL